MNEADLLAFFQSNPAFQSEYNRVRAAGDPRSPAQWLEAAMNDPRNPSIAPQFQQFMASRGGGATPGGQAAPFDAQAYAQSRGDLVNNWNNVLAWRQNPGDPRFANDPNIQAIAQFPSLEAYLEADWRGSGADPRFLASNTGNIPNGYDYESPTSALPLEQGILQQILPGLMNDIQGDAGRQQLVNILTGQAQDDYNAARNALSPEENARRLAEEYAMADTTSGSLSASANTAAAQQLAALQASIASMQQNLTGDLAAKASALQEQVAAFTANLNTFDAIQKAALAEQIAEQQQNLEQSITAQQQNLATEIASLRGAADAQSVARRAALQAEIDGLTSAQAPMAQARLDSAQALTTAVNLGLESERDRMTAERAKQGYLGSSSFSDASQTRATVGARQNAAQVMGTARESNAADIRAIEARRATEGRGIEDQLAGNLYGITGREATGTRSLADILAEGTRTLGDTNAQSTAAIKATTGQGLMNINNAGAAQSYQDKTMGSTDLRALLDALAQGQAGISGTNAQQQQQARDTGTLAKQGYFDNAYTRGQGGLLSRPGLSTNLASTLTQLGNYGNTGTQRALGILDWWSNNTTAPTAGYTPVQPSTSGNDIAGLGAGLLGAGLNVGNANNWWQTKKTGEDYSNSANDD